MLDNSFSDALHDYPSLSVQNKIDFKIKAHAYKLKFKDFNNSVTVFGSEEGQEKYNFFIGNNPSKWASNVSSYEKITYENIYPNINLIVSFDIEGNFKYDIEVLANANPELIKIIYEGLNKLNVSNSIISLNTSIGDFEESIPKTFQIINEKVQDIPCTFKKVNDFIQFSFPDGYKAEYSLIIDPTLVGASLSGTSSGSNYGHTATYDDQGNIYTGARSFGPGYPSTLGAFDLTYNGGFSDIVISKLSPTASSLIYATYIGGSGDDYPHSLVCHGGELILLGSTNSDNYPISAGAYDNQLNNGGGGGSFGETDICITRLNNNGTALIGSTYVGGTQSDGENELYFNYDDSYRGEIITDNSGNIYVASASSSNNFPVVNSTVQTSKVGLQDGVVFKMNSNLSTMLWSTYIAGSSQDDAAFGIRLNSSGEVYVAGGVKGSAFTGTGHQTTFSGQADGYIIKLAANGSSIIASTYIGTSSEEAAMFIDLDESGLPYVYGLSDGGALPITPAGVYSQPSSNQFIARYSEDLSTLEFSTLIGGGSFGYGIVPDAFMVDRCGYIYFSGYYADAGLPTTLDALFTTGNFYLAVLEPDAANLQYATYYTGSHVDGGTSRFDRNGVVYQAVCSGSGFNTTPGAWAPTQNGSWDIGVFKIDFGIQSLKADASASPNAVGCAPLTVNFQNTSVGGLTYIWNFDDGSPLDNSTTPSHTFVNPGVYDVMFIAIDSSSCIVADTIILTITVGANTQAVADFIATPDCKNLGVTISNLGTTVVGHAYSWDMGDGNTLKDSTNFTYFYSISGNYTIQLIVHDTVCNSSDTMLQSVVILPAVQSNFSTNVISGCEPLLVNFTNQSTNASSYVWDFNDGSALSNDTDPSHTFNAGSYNVMLISENVATCNEKDTSYFQITVGSSIPPTALFTMQVDCENREIAVINQSTLSATTHLWDLGDGNTSTTNQNFIHTYSTYGIYTVNLSVTDTICNLTTNHSLIADIQFVPPFTFGPDVYLCNNDTITLSSGISNVNYSWSTNDTTETLLVTTPGVYSLLVSKGSCKEYDTIIVMPTPIINLANEYEQCYLEEYITLYSKYEAVNYWWSTGSSTKTITVNKPGNYILKIEDEFGCFTQDTVKLLEAKSSADIYLPNTFTPNNNDINEVFKPVGIGIKEFEMKIYNRWGEEIFTDFTQNGWDGKIGNEVVEQGMYSYMVEYSNYCTLSKKVIKRGKVLLLR